jgi:hypothetical protein
MWFSGVRFLLSRYRKRGKKNFKFAVFGAQVAAHLIDNWPQKGTKNRSPTENQVSNSRGSALRFEKNFQPKVA